MQNCTLHTLHEYYNTCNTIYVRSREPNTPQFQKRYFLRLEEKKQFRIKKSKAEIMDKIILQQQLIPSFKPWSIPQNVEHNDSKEQNEIKNGNNTICRFVSVNNLRIKLNHSTQSPQTKEIKEGRFIADKRFRTSPGLKKLVQYNPQKKHMSFNNIVNRNTQSSLFSKQSFDDISPW